MGSDISRLYDPATLAAIHEAFETTWAVLQAHEPSPLLRKETQNSALGRVLVALAAEGVIDPAELRSRALQELPLVFPFLAGAAIGSAKRS